MKFSSNQTLQHQFRGFISLMSWSIKLLAYGPNENDTLFHFVGIDRM